MRRRLAWAYAAALTGVTVLGWLPWLADSGGRLFGVFRLTWYNDALHLASAAWAAGAALSGARASRLFLRVFGSLYLLDGLTGLAIGSGYLDLGVLINGVQHFAWRFKLEANAPHVILGSVALAAGLAWRPRMRSAAAAVLMLAVCPCAVQAATAQGAPDAQYRRPESNTYLSYPEWSIVYAYEDFAVVSARRGESRFDYLGSIGAFWNSLRRVTREAASHGAAPLDERAMLAIIGVSFTGEMLAKGAYETTLGRLTENLRGPVPTAEDLYAQHMASDYAHFLHQVPWYQYPFLSRVHGLWQVPFTADKPVRAVERRLALTLEWTFKSLYAQVMQAAAGLSPADLRIQTIVRGLNAHDLASDTNVHIMRALGDGALLIETPRYEAYTAIVAELSAQGGDFVEIAGNTSVLVTVLAPRAVPDIAGAHEIFSTNLQTRPGWRRVGLDVAVPHLAALVRDLPPGFVFEHVYDY